MFLGFLTTSVNTLAVIANNKISSLQVVDAMENPSSAGICRICNHSHHLLAANYKWFCEIFNPQCGLNK